MEINVIVAAVIALVPIVVYIYAMRKVVHASWRDVFWPFRRQSRGGTALPAAE